MRWSWLVVACVACASDPKGSGPCAPGVCPTGDPPAEDTETDTDVPDDTVPETDTDTTAASTGETGTAPLVPQPCGTWVSGFTVGGSGFETNSELAVASDGARYVAGLFTSPVPFGAGTPQETILTPAAAQDVYLARYDAKGGLEWAIQLGGSISVEVEQAVPTSDGGVVLGGQLYGEMTLPGGQVIASQGETEIWLARFDAAGAVVWATSAGSDDYDFVTDVTVLSDDTVVASGLFRGDATFGAGGANVVTLPIGAAYESGWLARFGTGGELLWVQAAGGTQFGRVAGVGRTSTDEIVTSAVFSGPGVAVLGAGQPGAVTLDPDGLVGVVARWDPDGTLGAVATNTAVPNRISVADDGVAYVAGDLQGTAVFDAGGPSEAHVTSTGQFDAWIARYEPDNTFAWVATSTTAPMGLTQTPTVAVAPDGGAVLLGWFTETTRFGVGTPTETTLPAGVDADYDVFAARYDASGALVCAVGIGGRDPDVSDDVIPLPDGTWWLSLTYGDTVSLGAAPDVFTAVGAQDLLVGTWWF